jgi:hypothetical protein
VNQDDVKVIRGLLPIHLARKCDATLDENSKHEKYPESAEANHSTKAPVAKGHTASLV